MSSLNVWVWPAAFAVWVLGVALGFWAGSGFGWDRGYTAAEDDEREERAEAMARRTYPVYRQRPDQFAAVREAGRRAWAIQQQHAAQQTGTAAFLDPPEAAAVALIRPDLTDSQYTQDMGERLGRFLDELFQVPYSADELWDRQ